MALSSVLGKRLPQDARQDLLGGRKNGDRMDSSKGFRLKVTSIGEVSAFLETFRKAALGVLAGAYGKRVAERAVELADFAAIGLAEPDGDLIAKACREVRKSEAAPKGWIPYPGLNCAVTLHFVRDAVLASFLHGSEEYLAAWKAMPETVEWPWHPGQKPNGMGEKAWRLRESYWRDALKGAAYGRGLKFLLVDNRLPDLSWQGIRKYVPPLDKRIEKCIARIADAPSPDFAGMDEKAITEKVKASVATDLGEKDFSASAKPKATTTKKPGAARVRKLREDAKRKASARKKDTEEKSAQVDHADILVALDGRTFVAVPYVGFDKTARVFVQVGDNHLAFSQSGTQFGYVTDVKKSALDVLRACRTVTLVEVGRKGSRRLLRAKHIAIVSDVGLSESFGLAMGRLKGFAAGDAEIRELDGAQ